MTAGKVAPLAGVTVLLPCGCPAREVRNIGIHQEGCAEGVHALPWAPRFVADDGGRAAAGYKGRTGDCVTRAIAIAARVPYQDVYDHIVAAGKAERLTKRRRTRSHPRTGVHKPTTRKVMEHYGGMWTPTMSIGAGTTIHVRSDELPTGRLALNLSGHVTAFIDGALHDTYDCSRAGTRCVYGFWTFPGDTPTGAA